MKQDFELNLTPVVDCFTVLITFMLVSASFLSVGILDAVAPTTSNVTQNQERPVEQIEIRILGSGAMELTLSGQVKKSLKIESKNGGMDVDEIGRTLGEYKKMWPKLDSVVLAASDDVEYLHLVKCMEEIRKLYPNIVLS